MTRRNICESQRNHCSFDRTILSSTSPYSITHQDDRSIARDFAHLFFCDRFHLLYEGLNVQQYLVKAGEIHPIDNVTSGPIDIPQDVARQMETERFGVMHVNVNGTVHTLAFTHSPDENFIYVIDVLQDEYLGPLHQTTRLILSTVAISLLVSALLSWFITKGITAPFQSMIKGMQQVSLGGLNGCSYFRLSPYEK